MSQDPAFYWSIRTKLESRFGRLPWLFKEALLELEEDDIEQARQKHMQQRRESAAAASPLAEGTRPTSAAAELSIDGLRGRAAELAAAVVAMEDTELGAAEDTLKDPMHPEAFSHAEHKHETSGLGLPAHIVLPPPEEVMRDVIPDPGKLYYHNHPTEPPADASGEETFAKLAADSRALYETTRADEQAMHAENEEARSHDVPDLPGLSSGAAVAPSAPSAQVFQTLTGVPEGTSEGSEGAATGTTAATVEGEKESTVVTAVAVPEVTLIPGPEGVPPSVVATTVVVVGTTVPEPFSGIEPRPDAPEASQPAPASVVLGEDEMVISKTELGDRIKKHVEEALAEREAELLLENDVKLREQADRLTSQWQQRLRRIEDKLMTEYNAERDERSTQLRRLVDAAQHALEVVAALDTFRVESSRYFMLSQSFFAFAQALEERRPFAKEMSSVVAVASAGGDAERSLLTQVLSSLESHRHKGIPTLFELQRRFEGAVFQQARAACFVPFHSGVLGHAFGWLIAALTSPAAADAPAAGVASAFPLQRSAVVDSEATQQELILVRAQRAVRDGDLSTALAELHSLPSGMPKKLARDWIAAATARLAANLAIQVLRSEIVLNAAAFEESHQEQLHS